MGWQVESAWNSAWLQVSFWCVCGSECCQNSKGQLGAARWQWSNSIIPFCLPSWNVLRKTSLPLLFGHPGCSLPRKRQNASLILSFYLPNFKARSWSPTIIQCPVKVLFWIPGFKRLWWIPSIAITFLINVQIVPTLTSGSPFRLAPVLLTVACH